MSLGIPLAPEDSSLPRFHPKYQQQTPALAAGLTDHIWSFRELLTAKFGADLSQSING